MNPHVSGSNGAHKKNGKSAHVQTDRTLSHGEPSQPLLGVLPITRWIPQDVHSVMDYVDGLTAASGALMADDDDAVALWASIALGTSAIGVSAMTDYRLSLAKIIPIRVHEAIDYAWGMSCIAAPFALGYWKSSPRTAMTHVMVGAGSILASLFTDYRSYRQERATSRRGRSGSTRTSGTRGTASATMTPTTIRWWTRARWCLWMGITRLCPAFGCATRRDTIATCA